MSDLASADRIYCWRTTRMLHANRIIYSARLLKSSCAYAATGLVLATVVVAIPLAHAETQAPPATCTDQVQQALRDIGGWAEAQCVSGVPAELALPIVTRCSEETLQGLRRVGGWAVVQCS